MTIKERFAGMNLPGSIQEVLISDLDRWCGAVPQLAEIPDACLEAVRNVYRYRTKEATEAARVAVREAADALLPDNPDRKAAEWFVLYRAVCEIRLEIEPVILNFVSGLVE